MMPELCKNKLKLVLGLTDGCKSSLHMETNYSNLLGGSYFLEVKIRGTFAQVGLSFYV